MKNESAPQTDAPNAEGYWYTANENPVEQEEENPLSTRKGLRGLSSDLRVQAGTESAQIKRSERTLNKVGQELSRSEIFDLIMARLSKKDSKLSMEQIDIIGATLIDCFASIEMAAEKLDMTPTKLRHLIRRNIELQAYFEAAQEGIKGLTDRRIIEGLMENDQRMVRLVVGKMYSGRDKGGFNIAEIGTSGYKDKVGKDLAAETQKDRDAASIVVQFNFSEKPINENVATKALTASGQIDDYIDAEEVE